MHIAWCIDMQVLYADRNLEENRRKTKHEPGKTTIGFAPLSEEKVVLVCLSLGWKAPVRAMATFVPWA